MENSSRRLVRAGVSAGAGFIAAIAGLALGLYVTAGVLQIRTGALVWVVPLASCLLSAGTIAHVLRKPALWGITDEPPRVARVSDAARAGEPDPDLFAQSVAALRAPLQAGAKRGWFWISLLAFVVLSRTGGWKTMAVLVPVLLFHELGHYAAMRAFGHDDARIFFLPFVGAITTSRKTNAHPWQRAVILLAGPVPGIVVGALLLTADGGLLPALGRVLILINGLNLLPFEPLDGGRLVSTLFFSRSGRLEAVFAGATTLVGVVYFLSTHQLVLAIAFGFTLVFLPLRSRAAQSAAALTGDYPAAVEDCPEPLLQQLYVGAMHVLPKARRTRPAAIASWMRDIHERHLATRPSSAAAAALIVTYVGSLALAAVTWVASPAPTPTHKPRAELSAR